MSRPTETPRSLWFGGAAILLIVLAWALRDLLILVGMSLLLAYALDPFVTVLERMPLPRGRRLPRGVASGMVILLLVAVVGTTLAFTVPRLAIEFGRFLERVPGSVQQLLLTVRDYATTHGLGRYVDPITDAARANATSLTELVAANATTWAGRLFSGIGQLLGVLVLPLLAFYLLAEREAVTESALRFIPAEQRDRILHGVGAVDRALRSYVRGQAIVCLVVGSLTWAVMALLELPLSLLLGVIAGLGEVIPYLGFLVAALAIGLTGLGVSPLHALAGILGYVAVNTGTGMFVTPRVMGRYLQMHPYVVTVSVLAGAELLGPGGVLLALPLAAVVQALIAEFAPRKESPSGRGSSV